MIDNRRDNRNFNSKPYVKPYNAAPRFDSAPSSAPFASNRVMESKSVPFYGRSAASNIAIGAGGSLVLGYLTGHPIAGVIGMAPGALLGNYLYEYSKNGLTPEQRKKIAMAGIGTGSGLGVLSVLTKKKDG